MFDVIAIVTSVVVGLGFAAMIFAMWMSFERINYNHPTVSPGPEQRIGLSRIIRRALWDHWDRQRERQADREEWNRWKRGDRG